VASEGTLLDRISGASLLFLGLVLGLAGGLYYAWILAPVVYVDASPARFSDLQKQEYIFLVSQSHAADGDWPLAQRRLATLDDPAISQAVVDLLEMYLRQQRQASEIKNLALLAQKLGAQGAVVALFAPTPLPGSAATPTASVTAAALPVETPTETPTRTPPPTLASTPTQRPSPTAQLSYRLLSQQRYCQRDEAAPLIVVITQDALLQPLPGVEVIVSWESGGDHFFTGFNPAEGPGYGDFTMSPDVSYTVTLSDGSPEVSGLRIESCSNGLDGGWQLTFQNLILRLVETPSP
jgi:hypothetical protein